MLVRKITEFRLHPLFSFGLIVFSIGGILSSFTSKMPMESLTAIVKYLYLIGIWFWLGTVIIRKETHIYTVIFLWSFSAAITSAGAMAQLVLGDVIPGVSPATGRMTGLTEHVNDLGGVTCIVLIPALALASQRAIGILRKCCLFIFTLLITVGLILSVSISGFIAAIMSFLFWLIISKPSIKIFATFIVICALALLTVSFSLKYGGISVFDRLTDVAEQKLYYETSESRIEVYRLAWKSISKDPLVGVGTGPYAGITETGDVVHNFLLLNWYESGVFGFLGILIILVSLAIFGIKVIRISCLNNDFILSTSLFASYLAFLVIGLAQPVYFKRFGWIPAALIMVLYVKHGRSRKQDTMHSMSFSTSRRVEP